MYRFNLQMGETAGLGRGTSILIYHIDGRGQSIWAILHCLPWHISKEAEWEAE